ncbi:MAG: hypothetical protein EXX96DRAFT_447306, partial [Benjaminiella poitrasii]
RKDAIFTSRNKCPRVLAIDASWCVSNKESLSIMDFVRQFKHTDQIYCHSRYKSIV